MRWPSRLVKTGNAHLRQAVDFPAIVAIRFNPPLSQFAARLRERGTSKMTIIVAVMRKLLTLVYGVFKSGRTFDPAHATA